MTTMTAAGLPGAGKLDQIREMELSQPMPGSGQLLVRVHAAGLNPVDWKVAQTGLPQWNYPHIPGIDVAGTIEALGPDVQGWTLGSRVNCMVDLRGPGTAAEYVVADAAAAALVPDWLTDTQAATLPCPGITAHQLVTRSFVTADDRVLVWGADGAVGRLTTQLAARTGAHVTSVSRDAARMRGYGVAVTLGRDEIQAAVHEGQFSVVLDCVGVPETARSMQWLSYGGRYTSVSQTAPLVPAFTTAPSITEIAIGAAYSAGTAEDVAGLGRALRWLNLQRLEVPDHTVVQLPEVGPALRRMQDRGGKAIARIPD